MTLSQFRSKLGVELTTVDLALQHAKGLFCAHSLLVVKCDVEREPLPFEDHSSGQSRCARRSALEGGSCLRIEGNPKGAAVGLGFFYLTTKSVRAR